MAACDPYIQDRKMSVFYYSDIFIEGDNIRSSYIDLLGGILTLTELMSLVPPTCRDLLMPFICQNTYSPCIYLDKNASELDAGLAIRNSTCRSVCANVFSACDSFFSNPQVELFLAAQHSLKYYRPCTATDDLISSSKDTYPVGNFSFWGLSIPCNPNLPEYVWPSPVPAPPPAKTVSPVNTPAPSGQSSSNIPNTPSGKTSGPATRTTTGSIELVPTYFGLFVLLASVSCFRILS